MSIPDFNKKPKRQYGLAGVVLWTSHEFGQNEENLKLQHEMVKQGVWACWTLLF